MGNFTHTHREQQLRSTQIHVHTQGDFRLQNVWEKELYQPGSSSVSP